MNFKNMYAYNLYEDRKSLIIFYGVIASIYLMFIIANMLINGDSSIGGMEMSSFIFLFVMGLNSFKSNFHFGLTNGVSRKTQFLSYAATALTLGIIMAVMDIVISKLVAFVVPPNSLYLQLYGQRYSSFVAPLSFLNHVQIIMEQFLWYTFLYSAVAMFGYCITLIYYRSTLILKWIVSVIPFLLLFVVFPYVETITQGAVSQFIGNFISRTMGFAGQTINPFIAIMSFIIGYLIFGAISFLLVRRAVVKQ